MSDIQRKNAQRQSERAKQREAEIKQNLPSTKLKQQYSDRMDQLKAMSAVFQSVFYNERGRMVLAELKKRWRYQRSIFNKDPQMMAYQSGKQDAINEIMQILEERYNDE